MIEIDVATQKIFFYHQPEDLGKRMGVEYKKSLEKMYEFPLLSGYVCPECGAVLEAYFIGELPLTSNNSYSGYLPPHPYAPPTPGHPSLIKPKHDYGQAYGGGYFIFLNHNKNRAVCKTVISEKKGIENGIVDLLKDHELDPVQVEVFATKIKSGEIQGVNIISDVCGVRPPILSIDVTRFIKGVQFQDYTEYKKELYWSELLFKLITGHQDLKILPPES